jgi:hypothetical protein
VYAELVKSSLPSKKEREFKPELFSVHLFLQKKRELQKSLNEVKRWENEGEIEGDWEMGCLVVKEEDGFRDGKM